MTRVHVVTNWVGRFMRLFKVGGTCLPWRGDAHIFLWAEPGSERNLACRLVIELWARGRLSSLKGDWLTMEVRRLLSHELGHAEQVKRMGGVGYLRAYLWGLRKGYRNHDMEHEAQAGEWVPS